MPKFLSREEIYRILQRELPDAVYADGQPNSSYSCADNDSVASVIATLYGNLQRVYDNFFPATADEKLADWEFEVFGEYLDSGSLTLAERRDRVLTKIRSRQGITIQDMIDVTKAVIGSDKQVSIIEQNCDSGAWILNKSRLSQSTFLRRFAGMHLGLFGPNTCEKTAAEMGLTESELLAYRRQAYTYEVLIIGYTPTTEELIKIDQELTKKEPARSTHIIRPNYGPVVIYPSLPVGLEEGGFLLTEEGGVILQEG